MTMLALEVAATCFFRSVFQYSKAMQLQQQPKPLSICPAPGAEDVAAHDQNTEGAWNIDGYPMITACSVWCIVPMHPPRAAIFSRWWGADLLYCTDGNTRVCAENQGAVRYLVSYMCDFVVIKMHEEQCRQPVDTSAAVLLALQVAVQARWGRSTHS